MSPSRPRQRTLALWRSRLAAALRPALACTLIECAKLYGPHPLRRRLTFPAFSYVVAILTVSEATAGEALRGVAYGAYGTVLGVCPAILSLWAIGPARLSLATTTLAVSLSAFVVALPGSTKSNIMTKRVALGQIVLIYVVAYMQGARMEAIMHPVEVAVSTGVGLLACVLAMLLPCPRLGYHQVKKKSKVYTELASKKLKFFSAAFCAENRTSANDSIAQAKALDHTGKKLLQIIIMKQESMPWERPTIRFSPAHFRSPADRLPMLEMSLKGMDLALTSCPKFPIKDEQLKHHVICLTEGINLKLKQMHCSPPSDLSNAPEIPLKELLPQSPQVAFPTIQDLPPHFFLFCMSLLHEFFVSPAAENPLENGKISTQEDTIPSKQNMPTSVWAARISGERLLIAFKCSFALGLSTLFGLLFSKDNGFWAALGVAITLSPCREATFREANLRAQGTVLGSVYGILACLIPEKNEELGFLVFLPWIIFTSFLRNSKMYGQAGAISATIAATILTFARRGKGSPSEFAIARITETFIGLACWILVELLLQPVRASSLAKRQLSTSIGALHECIGSTVFNPHSGKLSGNVAELKDKEKKLIENVIGLGKFIEEAEAEPSFWFLPFPSACYRRLLGSLSKMVDLLAFEIHAMEFLGQGYHRFCGAAWKNIQEHMNRDLEHFKKAACTPLKCFEEITRMKSLSTEKEWETCDDTETGKAPKAASGCWDLGVGDEEIQEILSCFLANARDSLERVGGVEGEEEMKRSLTLCIGAMGFCMEGLMGETSEIGKGVKELVRWENPTGHLNLHDIIISS